MSSGYARAIKPYVEAEIRSAEAARAGGDTRLEFARRENAHVLGQEATFWHTKVHLLMLLWAIRNYSFREFFGQLLRIIGALTKTAIGLVPAGNTGGTDVSPFRPMPVPPELAKIIQEAKEYVSIVPHDISWLFVAFIVRRLRISRLP